MSNNTLVQAEHLENFVQALFMHAGMDTEPARSVARYSIIASTDFSTCTATRAPAGSFSEASRLAIMAVARSRSRQL